MRRLHKKNGLLFLGAILLSNTISAQSLENAATTITIPELKDHLYYLASDVLEGRAPDTKGFEAASGYAVSQFEQAGIKPLSYDSFNDSSYFQPFTYYNVSLNDSSSLIWDNKGKQIKFEKDDNYILYGYGQFENEIVEGEVVNVGYGICEPEYGIDEYKNKKAHGKWVILKEIIPMDTLSGLPDSLINQCYIGPESVTIRANNAYNHGAIGLLIIPSENGFKYWKPRADYYQTIMAVEKYGNLFRNTPLPVMLIDSSLITQISINQSNHDGGHLAFRKNLTKLPFKTHNVVGFLKGKSPVRNHELIIVGAHLDHLGTNDGEIYNGADDNASGVSAILELAEALAMNPPDRSILFCLFSAEELGLLGSHYFTGSFTQNMNSIAAMINIDMIGRIEKDIHGIVPIGFSNTEFNWQHFINDVGKKYKITELDWEFANNFPYKNSSDHYLFVLEGIPAIFFHDGMEEDLHKPTDDADRIDYEALKNNSQLIYHVIYELANRKDINDIDPLF